MKRKLRIERFSYDEPYNNKKRRWRVWLIDENGDEWTQYISFTREGCRDYIRKNKHRIDKL